MSSKSNSKESDNMKDFKLFGMIISVLVLNFHVCDANNYWVVRPNVFVHCPMDVASDHCVTLNDIAANSTMFFTDNTIIHFLGGTHTADSSENCWIGILKPTSRSGQTRNVTVAGTSRQPAVIDCQNREIGFIFHGVTGLSLSRLVIRNCGFNISRNSQQYTVTFLPNVYAAMYMDRITNLKLTNITVTDSTGIGLLAVALRADIVIEDSNFQYNIHGIKNGKQSPNGNVYIILKEFFFAYSRNLRIENTTFAHGLITNNRQFFKCNCFSCNQILCQVKLNQSAGLNIYVESLSETDITITNCTFYNNSAPFGAHLRITLYADDYFYGDIRFKTDNCTFTNGNAWYSGGGVYIQVTGSSSIPDRPRSTISFDSTKTTFTKNIAKDNGGAIAIKATLFSSTTYINISRCELTDNRANVGAGISIEVHPQKTSRTIQHTVISKCMFTSNKALNNGAAIATKILLDSDSQQSPAISHYVFESVFVNNMAVKGSALYTQLDWRVTRNTFIQKISNCTFLRNLGITPKIGSVIYFENIENLLLNGLKIIDNKCSGIEANMTTIEIGHNVWITNNSAMQGAGITLICNALTRTANMSRLILTKSSLLYLQNNHAQRFGGGILVETGCSKPQVCFFKPPVEKTSNEAQLVHMNGNTAGNAGDSIYGGNLENCVIESANLEWDKTVLSRKVFSANFDISESNEQPSVVASQAYRTCICNSNFTTSHYCEFTYNVQVYPGQTFNIPVVGVGQYNYSSPSVIRAVIVSEYMATLGEQQTTQDVNLFCKNLTYTIKTYEKKVIIQLIVEVPFSSDSTLPDLQSATVNVTVLDCPLGFEFYENSSTCDCTLYLAEKGIICNIMDQTVYKTGAIWIGDYFNTTVLHYNCPFDYCNQTVQDVSLYKEEEQCNFNRAGVLCGRCQLGLSLMLGTSLCNECSNVYLLLLLPITLAGFMLVVLLLKCNLTVSMGTINGLILYANILQVNKNIFFLSTRKYTTTYILSIFIAWINLDLGIEVCFADSLETYSRTWLQFLFPIYIWFIIGLLIVACRYSTTLTRWTGYNTVSVLATLFLLSYAKLLRTTFDIFSPTAITDQRDLVWLLDGNYQFLQWPHLALFLAGLVTLLVHLTPFTILVLLGPTLQTHSNYKLLRWVTKFKPFLDTYQGPYKTKYRFWTGAMLLVRIFLFIVFAANALGNPNVNLLTILLTILVLLIVWVKVGRVYRKFPLNALELFYLLNLGIITGATLYLRNTDGAHPQSQAILSGIMVGSVCVVFIGTLVYHCYSEIVQSRSWKNLKDKLSLVKANRDNQADETVEPDTVQIQVKSPTRTVVSLSDPLLSDEDYN